MAQIVQVNRDDPSPEIIEQARAVLADGGLVIVPTETVYGIACDPSVPGATDRLIAAKGRDGNKPIARLAANEQQVKAEATDWNIGLQALADKFWPGSLTIVLKTGDTFTGFRVPDHPVALALANVCDNALALTSANQSGGPDPRTAQDADNAVNSDLVLDSGPASDAALPSTVIKVDGDSIECLREGCLPFNEVESVFKGEERMKQILFVCTGNTCRSPMAKALFNVRIGEGTGWKAASAGLYASDGSPASELSISALSELDIDLSGHRSSYLTAERANEADMIITMTENHRLDLLHRHPELEPKVFLIKSFGSSKVAADISDPFGGSMNIYRNTRDEIDQALSDLVLFLRTGK